jgi:hypothetical protein
MKIEKIEGRIEIGKVKSRRKSNIKTDTKNSGMESYYVFNCPRIGFGGWLFFLKNVMKFWDRKKAGNLSII